MRESHVPDLPPKMQACLRQLTSRPLLVPRLVNPHILAPQRFFGTYSLLRPRFQGHQPPASHRWLSTPSRPLFRHYVRPKPLPSRQFLGFLDKIPHNTVFYGVIGLNCLVFGMWFMAIQKYVRFSSVHQFTFIFTPITSRNKKEISRPSFGCKPILRIAGKISSRVDCEFYSLHPYALRDVRYHSWTLVTACFSHRDWAHILFNGFTFFFMAQPVLNMLGSRQFIFLYLGGINLFFRLALSEISISLGGLVSCITGMTYAEWMGKNDYASHGASGQNSPSPSLFNRH